MDEYSLYCSNLVFVHVCVLLMFELLMEFSSIIAIFNPNYPHPCSKCQSLFVFWPAPLSVWIPFSSRPGLNSSQKSPPISIPFSLSSHRCPNSLFHKRVLIFISQEVHLNMVHFCLTYIHMYMYINIYPQRTSS